MLREMGVPYSDYRGPSNTKFTSISGGLEPFKIWKATFSCEEDAGSGQLEKI